MHNLFSFLASSAGRVIRALAGIVLIILGLAVIGGVGGYIVAIVGLIPLAAGAFDFCVFAPLAGLPFGGSQLRGVLQKKLN
jgi:Protein of unknown function (DUF2892)